jgi:hypothetical protein
MLSKFLQRIESVCIHTLFFHLLSTGLNRFALRGNVVDLVVGIIIGTAFPNVVKGTPLFLGKKFLKNNLRGRGEG